MEKISFIFTICFVLLGPLKVIPAFARLTRDEGRPFATGVAVKAALIATVICLSVSLVGRGLVTKYQLSLPALELGGGLVLLLAALRGIFSPAAPVTRPPGERTSLQVSIELATPIIVTPAGVAAILIFATTAPMFPGMDLAVALVLVVILALDFLAMYFNAKLVRLPGFLATLQVSGEVLVFIQVALAIETMLGAAKSLGAISA